ncbi:hypothetical protein QYS48_16965 [Marivirga arenosa]|uniref:Uncharacterized protein n=1 Tax=Marivirga arenosa TaxID=3059076 RepID=A0AA49GFZ3_9BACT|nr:hypothetical protein [Marivirga sp. ABR2-2]WKK83931.1 hypothetical protein QYS48_16965 [Marivirga sp. ABR2-2]
MGYNYFYIVGWFGASLLVGLLGKDRKIGFAVSFIVSLLLSPLIGLIVTSFSARVIKVNQRSNYKVYKELGAKAEYKDKTNEAIDHYMDALYHLENDYKNKKISKSQNEKRLQHIDELKRKVEELKKKSA